MKQEGLRIADCLVQEDDSGKEKVISILEQGREIGRYTVYYYFDDSDEVYFSPVADGREGKPRMLSGLYQPYAYGARSIRQSIIIDLEKMGYQIEDAERKLSKVW